MQNYSVWLFWEANGQMDGYVKYKPFLSLAYSIQNTDQDNQSQKYWNLYENNASNVTHFLNGYFKIIIMILRVYVIAVLGNYFYY